MGYLQFLSCSSDLGNCCSDPGIVMLLESIRRIVKIVHIIVPIVLMVAASFQFGKMMLTPDDKNGIKGITNKVIAAAIVFFIPVFIDVALGVIPKNFSVSACWSQVKVSSEAHRSFNYKHYSVDETRKQQSIYTDPSYYEKGVPKEDGVGAGSAEGILEGAKKVHAVYEKNKWAYYSSLSQLRWNDIKYSTNNPHKRTCCATLVGSAFYVGGVFTEKEINKYNYNAVSGISQLLQAHHWTKITKYSKLAPGDIVIMTSGGSGPGHVQIYAGNGTWYNAGSTEAIQRKNPYKSDASGRFLYAYRKPS